MKPCKTVRFGSRDGVTVVEVVVAVVILSMCIGGLCRLVLKARETSDQARSHYQAANIAKNRLERIKTFDFDQIEEFEEDEVLVDTSGSPVANSNFRRTTTVTLERYNLKNVRVEVGIRNPVSREFDGEEETIQTYIADFADTPGT